MSSSNSLQLPLVSAVIPTRNRPELVCRAVRSVLQQTYLRVEAVVVIDGPDVATVDALEALHDARVRIVALQENVGGSEARNVGVRHARGEWIALLDDDDEWFPEKIERQIKTIAESGKKVLFSATEYIDRRDKVDSLHPKRFPFVGEHISEYLFCEMDIFTRRTTFLQTSTWMVERSFFLEHPFLKGLKRNQDTDWLLRYYAACADHAIYVSVPLAIFYRINSLKRVSSTLNWKDTFGWAQDNRRLFTHKGLAFLVMTVCARSANREKAPLKTIFSLWRLGPVGTRYSMKMLTCLVVDILHSIFVKLSNRS